jgi:hypothetical protein
VIRVTTAAVMMTWMAVAGARLAAQDLRIDAGDPAAIRTTVEMLALNVGQFAGMRIRIIDANVDKIISPRAFVLVGQRVVSGVGKRARIGVIVVSGTANLVKDMPIMVSGAAGTPSGAQVSGVLTRIEALTEQERDALSKYPLVMALSVDTPANVSLLRGEPAPAPAPAPAR